MVEYENVTAYAENTYAERVERGAEQLDRLDPTWYQRVDVSTLDMNHVDRCVLAQAFNNYFDTRDDLFSYSYDPIEESAAHGFTLGDHDPYDDTSEDWAKLEVEWTKQITKRREQEVGQK